MRKARILAVLLALITAVSFCVPAVYAKNAKFKAGTNKISVKLWDWQKDQPAYSSDSIKSTGTLRVKNGKLTLTVYPTIKRVVGVKGSLKEFKVSNGKGGWINAKVTARYDNGWPAAFTFPLYSSVKMLKIKINPKVAFNGYKDMDARLKISYAGVK